MNSSSLLESAPGPMKKTRSLAALNSGCLTEVPLGRMPLTRTAGRPAAVSAHHNSLAFSVSVSPMKQTYRPSGE
jgi:hypothetical protein